MMPRATRRPVVVYALTALDVALFVLLALTATALGLFLCFGPQGCQSQALAQTAPTSAAPAPVGGSPLDGLIQLAGQAGVLAAVLWWLTPRWNATASTVPISSTWI